MTTTLALVGAQTLTFGDVELPPLADHEVRLRVRAAGVNRADLVQRAGLYPPPPGASPVLGLECAGEIEAVGAAVTGWRIGGPACALLSGGGYARHVQIDARHLLPVPAGLTLTEAAGLPEVFATAWLNLFEEAALAPGERVLLLAGASGVGTAAIQLCRAFGHPVFVSVGSADKLRACLDLGATAGAVRDQHALTELAGDKGVDVILDPVGGTGLGERLDLLRPGGRLVLIGIMAGRRAELDLGRLLVKRLRLLGSTLRSRDDDFKAGLIARLREQVWPLFGQGALRPVLDRVYSWQEVEAAHARLASNQTVGKLILTVD